MIFTFNALLKGFSDGPSYFTGICACLLLEQMVSPIAGIPGFSERQMDCLWRGDKLLLGIAKGLLVCPNRCV